MIYALAVDDVGTIYTPPGGLTIVSIYADGPGPEIPMVEFTASEPGPDGTTVTWIHHLPLTRIRRLSAIATPDDPDRGKPVIAPAE